MITLGTGQVLLTDESWAVLSGGEFPPDSLVECYRLNDPEQKTAYYAQFILTGEFPQ